MFTGIIECTGTVEQRTANGSNVTFLIRSSISHELRVDQSLAHDGICLTVEAVNGHLHQVTAIEETLKKTSLEFWQPGTVINLERSLQLGGRVDGHLVQGHVDTRGTCRQVTEKNGSWELDFEYPQEFAELLVEKGSIALNGISLTVFNVTHHSFTVGIIPYTWQHTNICHVRAGSRVNLEFDIIGKYVQRSQQVRKPE
ncbi:MAG: riboflavin synthase [Lacibacter sp.]|jgi:riboflavin synthase